MNWTIRSLFLSLLGFAVIGALANVSAQNTDAPRAVVEVLNDVKLGLQVKGGVQYRRREVIPLQQKIFTYMQRRVSGTFSHSVPYYGVGVALEARGAKVAFTYLLGEGVQSAHWLQFQEGSNAIPYEPNFSGWAIRAEYFVLDWIGAGVSYRDQNASLRQSYQTPINGEVVRAGLFQTTVLQSVYSAYVPLQKEWRGIGIIGRVGTSVVGRIHESYNALFVKYQSVENPGHTTTQNPSAPTRFGSELESKDPIFVQFGRVGVEVAVWQTTVRTVVGIERLQVPDLSTTWSYDVQMEVGLPF